MGSTRSLVRARATAQEQEWVDAELVEHVELLEAQVASLETERDRLETELSIARSWVKELALWLDEAQMRTKGKALPAVPADDLAGMILSPRTARLLEDAEVNPGKRDKRVSLGRLVAEHVVIQPHAVSDDCLPNLRVLQAAEAGELVGGLVRKRRGRNREIAARVRGVVVVLKRRL